MNFLAAHIHDLIWISFCAILGILAYITAKARG
jgi:hypothetical protein